MNTRKLCEDEQLDSLVRSFALVFYIILSNVTTIVGVLEDKSNHVSPVHYPASPQDHHQLSLQIEQLALQMEMEQLQMLK